MIDDAVEVGLKNAQSKGFKERHFQTFLRVATGLIHPPYGPGYEMCQLISLSRAMINKVRPGVDKAGGEAGAKNKYEQWLSMAPALVGLAG